MSSLPKPDQVLACWGGGGVEYWYGLGPNVSLIVATGRHREEDRKPDREWFTWVWEEIGKRGENKRRQNDHEFEIVLLNEMNGKVKLVSRAGSELLALEEKDVQALVGLARDLYSKRVKGSADGRR